jgi:hypothetical protein
VPSEPAPWEAIPLRKKEDCLPVPKSRRRLQLETPALEELPQLLVLLLSAVDWRKI